MRRLLCWFMLTLCGNAELRAQGSTAARARDSVNTRRVLERSATSFFRLWQQQWRRSSRTSRSDGLVPRDGKGSLRLRNAHCHWDGSYYGVEGKNNPEGLQRGLIQSAFTSFSICPDWIDEQQTISAHEAEQPDAGLLPEPAATALTARRKLQASFDSAAAKYPGDGWIAGQRVRFALELQDTALAERAAHECQSDRGWCAGLLGLVMHRHGRLFAADSMFALLLANLDDRQACAFTSVAPLLEPSDHRRYNALNCTAQSQFNTVFWWLADPMFSEAGNERRTEHYARRMRLLLHTALPNDGHYSYADNVGGDAIQSMFIRYGWPSYTWWGGPMVDQSHSQWLGADAVEPYSAPEYSLGRLSTTPSFDAVLNPLTTSNGDFDLHAPAETPRRWWPREHFRRDAGVIGTMDEGQLATFRRDSTTMIAVAARLASPVFQHRVGEFANARFVLSPAPDAAMALPLPRTAIGATLLMRANLDTMVGIAGIEVSSEDRGGPSGRSRFGIAIPSPLHRLPPGTRSVSIPVLFRVIADDPSLPDNAHAATERMFTSLRLESPQRIGIFWESYGFRPQDSVAVSVRLQRITTPGRWQRLGMALGLADDPNSAVAISWEEPQPGRTALDVPAIVPTLGRRLVLDVSSLVAGEYRLRISMQPRGGAPVVSERVFAILR